MFPSLQRESGHASQQDVPACDLPELRGGSLMNPHPGLMALLDLLPVAVYACEAPTGVIRWFNRHAVELWGRTPAIGVAEERFCGSYKLYTVEGRVLRHAHTPAALVLKDGEPRHGLEVVIERPDGKRIVALVNLEPVRDADGRVAGSINVFQDITERKRTEEALRRNQQHLKLLTDHIPQLVWEAAADGQLEYWNASMIEYIGSGQNVRGWKWRRHVHPDDLKATENAWKAARDRQMEYEVEHRILGADGAYRWFLTRALPLHGHDGSPCRWCGTSTDIEARKRAEQQDRAAADSLQLTNAALHRANHDLEQFAYAAAHDLREPLRNIALYAQMLDRTHVADLSERARASLGYITQSAKRMDALVHDLLSYAQVVQATGHFESASLRAAFERSCADLQAGIDESGAEVEIEGADCLVHMRTVHLALVLQNLIENAIKYRRAGIPPVIRISVETRDGLDCIRVKDNGIGIKAEYRDRIFGVFKRLHGREVEGTGIGLAICKRIVEHYNGRIWVESNPGEGSTFSFAVPVATPVS